MKVKDSLVEPMPGGAGTIGAPLGKSGAKGITGSPSIKALVRVTTACDLACKHCYVNSSKFRSERMSLEDMRRVVDELLDSGVKNIIFTGGQPTLVGEDLIDIIRYAKERSIAKGCGARVHITTNSGFGKNDETAEAWIRKFKDAGLDQIRLSCDKWHREFYPKRMERTIIKVARRHRLPVKIMNVVPPTSDVKNNAESEARKTFALRPGGRAGKQEYTSGWDNIPKCRITKCRDGGEEISLFIEPNRDVHLCNVDIRPEMSLGKILDHKLGEIIFERSPTPEIRALAEGDVQKLGEDLGCRQDEIAEKIREIGRCATCCELRRKKAATPQ